MTVQLLSSEGDGALGRPHPAAAHVKERGLAGAVGTDEPGDGSAFGVQRGVIDRHDSTESDRYLLDVEVDCHSCLPVLLPRGRTPAPFEDEPFDNEPFDGERPLR